MKKKGTSNRALKALQKRVSKLEAQGFILPQYVYKIKRPKTASKYSEARLMNISKFRMPSGSYETEKKKKEPEKGNVDVLPHSNKDKDATLISGKVAREKILSERAKKGARTKWARKNPVKADIRQDEAFLGDFLTRERKAAILDMRLMQYFNQFGNKALGEVFRDIYLEAKSKASSELAFLLALLDVKDEVIEEVQKALIMKYPDNTAEEMNDAGNAWLNFLTNNAPTTEQKIAVADAEDQG